MDIIYLDQATAKTMTDMKGLVNVYSSRNVAGKFDENIEKYSTIYSNMMNEILGR